MNYFRRIYVEITVKLIIYSSYLNTLHLHKYMIHNNCKQLNTSWFYVQNFFFLSTFSSLIFFSSIHSSFVLFLATNLLIIDIKYHTSSLSPTIAPQDIFLLDMQLHQGLWYRLVSSFLFSYFQISCFPFSCFPFVLDFLLTYISVEPA